MRRNNRLRAQWAQKAVTTFVKETGMEDEDKDTQLSDLLADLRHWSDKRGVDFHRCLDRSYEHYIAEIHAIEDPMIKTQKFNELAAMRQMVSYFEWMVKP